MTVSEQSIEPGALSPKAGFRFTRRQYVAVFLVFAVIIFLAFQVFLSERYKNDSYSHFAMSPLQTAKLHLGGYRFIPAINMLLYSLANVHDIDAQMLNTACLLVCLSLSATIVFLALCKKLGSLSPAKLILIAAAVTLLYVNTFVSALTLFPETGMFMGAGYLFVTLAAVFIAKKRSIANCLVSFVFLSAALGTYQALLGFYSFVAFSLLIAEYGLALNRETIKRALIILSIMALASIGNILLGKALCSLFGVVQNDRAVNFSLHLILSNIVSIIKQQGSVWNGLLHTAPRFLGLLVCAFLMLCVIANFLIQSAQKIRGKELSVSRWIGNTLFSCFVFLFCYAAVFAPFIPASSAYLSVRGILSFFGVYLLLAVMLIVLTNSSRQHWAATAAIGLLLLFCALGITRMGVEQNMVNALDLEYAQQVTNKIDSYERQSGADVTKIAMINDKHPTYVYDSVYHYCAPYRTMMRSTRVVSWGQVALINKQLGRNLERVSMPEDILAAHFEGKNWDFFVPSEQMFFEGDTVYIAAY